MGDESHVDDKRIPGQRKRFKRRNLPVLRPLRGNAKL